jgi:hypothetical protein
MPVPITRQRMTIDEALDVIPVPLKEVELPRTPNMNDATNPTWDSGLRTLELGLHNAEQDTLSNMLVEKMSRGPSIFKLSDILELMDKQYNFILALVEKLLAIGLRGVNNAIQSKSNTKK